MIKIISILWMVCLTSFSYAFTDFPIGDELRGEEYRDKARPCGTDDICRLNAFFDIGGYTLLDSLLTDKLRGKFVSGLDFDDVCGIYSNNKMYMELNDCLTKWKTFQLLRFQEYEEFFNEVKEEEGYEKHIGNTFTRMAYVGHRVTWINYAKDFVKINYYEGLQALEYNDFKLAIEYFDKGIDFVEKYHGERRFGPLYAEMARLAGISAIYAKNSALAQKYQQKINSVKDIDNKVSDYEAFYLLKNASIDFLIAEQGYDEARYLNQFQVSKSVNIDYFDMVWGITKIALGNGIQAIDGLITASGSINFDRDLNTLPLFYKKAKLLLVFNKQQEAKDIYLQLQNAPALKQHKTLEYLVYNDLALIEKAEGNTEMAIRYFKTAIEHIESQRKIVNTDIGKITFMGDKQEVYWNFISYLIALNQVELAFEYVERSRSRALVDMLANKKAFKKLSKELNNDLTNQSDIALVHSGYSSSQDSRAFKRKNTHSLKDINTILGTEKESIVSVSTVNLPEVQSLLSGNESILEYYQYKSELLAFVVDNKGIKVAKLKPVSSALVNEFSKVIKNNNTERFTQISSSLYNALVEPIDEHLKARILLVPHGELHGVPFYALNKKGQFMIDNYELSIIPSASAITYLDKTNKATSSVIAFGDPNSDRDVPKLANAKLEAHKVSNLFASNLVLTENKATEASFKEYANQFGVIHYAGHALYNEQMPLKSSLLMAKSGVDDGELTLSEIYDLDISAELVVLSACETSLGYITAGDESIGLNRGFLTAGAKGVVSSLWKVSDKETAQLMELFYQNYKNEQPSKSLRNAALHMKNTLGLSPFFWASFQFTGRT
ncbi:CHAT domain-containing protein [Catenovulum sp. SM1970]|uniref:CHAT domain-containing protein n=1 Tax=Marinifaba aquimaris TaxID=2741323 RepID=UPI0015727BE4|nr:CHAT domain-containing protein [Marinifaba aquimaris]NTS77489.1 CHAT domain-containing protein [Marinifaba aquimaris]